MICFKRSGNSCPWHGMNSAESPLSFHAYRLLMEKEDSLFDKPPEDRLSEDQDEHDKAEGHENTYYHKTREGNL